MTRTVLKCVVFFQDKTLLQGSSTFSCLVAHPKLLDLDNKKAFFRSELKRRNANQRNSSLRIRCCHQYDAATLYFSYIMCECACQRFAGWAGGTCRLLRRHVEPMTKWS